MGSKKILFIITSLTASLLLTTPVQAANTFYVSKTGNNSSGLSWVTAWNELSQINWDLIQPGDKITLDGGPVACNFPVVLSGTTNDPQPSGCGMTYQSTLSINKSGAALQPILIELSSENGRNGTVRIFGGRSSLVPSCNHTYTSPSGIRKYGINFNGANVRQGINWVTLDGSHWGGIMVYGHSEQGITFNGDNCLNEVSGLSDNNLVSNATLKNLEIFDNGATTSVNGEGIRLSGKNIIMEQMLNHDNGQDSIQVDTKTENIKLSRSWFFNSRSKPEIPNQTFNDECTHSDAIQIYAGHQHKGLTIENSILGPGFREALMLGDYSTSSSCIGTTVVHDVTLRNSLFVGHHGTENLSSAQTKSNSAVVPTNYTFDHVTSVRDIFQNDANIYIRGNNHHVKNSVFSGGKTIQFLSSNDFSNNYLTNDITSNSIQGSVISIGSGDNPNNYNLRNVFVDPDYDGVMGDPDSPDTSFADFNFDIIHPSIQNAGSTIASVADLLGSPTSSIPPTPSPSPSPSPTPKPGDANGDTKVDGLDYVVWLNHYNQSVTGASNGDFNGSGKVDGVDYVLWVGNYGQ